MTNYLFYLAIILFSCVSCSQSGDNKDSTENQTAQAPVITIQTQDYTFVNVPDSVQAGPTTIRVQNEGIFPHNASFVYLDEGYTYQQYIEYLETHLPEQVPEWASLMGGPSAPISGESSEATLDLKPGNYAIVCGVPVPAAEPHYMKGMTHALTVIPASQGKPPVPEADLGLTMDDYSFDMSSEISPGTHTVQVENKGEQPHEFILARLDEGAAVKDLIGWLGLAINAEGGQLPKAPGVFLNGVSPMDVGETNFITVDFEPGTYALVCPYPDKDSGNPHFVHGMASQFTVE